MSISLEITLFTVPLMLAVHLGVLMDLSSSAGNACKFKLIRRWNRDILLSIEFTCWDWMFDLYQLTELTIFDGDGPVSIEENLHRYGEGRGGLNLAANRSK